MRPEDEAAAPFVPWDEFCPWFVARWEQGDHVSIIGQTKSGKSVFALAVIEARTAASRGWHSVVLANKPKDRTLSELAAKGWQKIGEWPPRRLTARVLLWPSMTGPDSFTRQRYVFDRALRAIFKGGRWCVYADEVRYLTRTLRLQSLVELLWLQGRSNAVTFVAATQRAAYVPLEFYSQARWLVVFRERSSAARRALTNHVGGADGAQVARIVADLEQHEALVIDTHTGAAVRTRVDR